MPRIKWCDWRVTWRYSDGETASRTIRATGADMAASYVEDAINWRCTGDGCLCRSSRTAETLLVERVR